MDGKKSACIRILGLLLLILIFTMQAQAATFPSKAETNVTPALEQARVEMKQVIATYEHEHKFNLEEELAEARSKSNLAPGTEVEAQNETPNWSLMAANRGK